MCSVNSERFFFCIMSKGSKIKCRLYLNKVPNFWETHKIWKKNPHGFDKSVDLLSKCQNHEEDFFQIMCASQNVRTLLTNLKTRVIDSFEECGFSTASKVFIPSWLALSFTTVIKLTWIKLNELWTLYCTLQHCYIIL